MIEQPHHPSRLCQRSAALPWQPADEALQYVRTASDAAEPELHQDLVHNGHQLLYPGQLLGNLTTRCQVEALVMVGTLLQLRI